MMQFEHDSGFARLLLPMLPKLWTFALRLTGDRHDAEDLVQRACVRALERADAQLRPDSAPLNWLYSIVHSLWLNELRARNVRNRGGVAWDDALLENIADSVSGLPDEHVGHRQIVDAVERLPAPQRVALLLVAVEGFSYREAAQILDVPVATVMGRLSAARQRLGVQFDVTPRRRGTSAVGETPT
ncbi:RNA polymerase sigma factor [Pandoraea sputorum]|uniref:RNA polymerase sigma factor sigM n=1 Tax=Pandoraea sputorum TaxID=93222 RepID=A0A239SEH6_9BURK|nr:RNA polymerase sigma factor [Pandoraea sputorum]SNU83836.1 RNA polymerase sigma factor sigM [Pandoraea sputorum]VVE77182.1 RNA polymerase subunit sigma-70 [Pandoraea sputorum]VVE79816.1 RNA polymerase subunit sigma-70 [Pandoraea sputorum]